MSTIPARKFVDVLPGVLNAGGSALDLINIALTTSFRVPIGTVQSFPSATTVAAYFGPSSNEAGYATVYFNGFDTSTKKPAALLFVQYPMVAAPAYLQSGHVAGLTLASIQALNASLSVSIDGYVHTSSNINLSAATSFSAAAALIQQGLTATEPTECTFTGAMSAGVLTVSAVASGTISIGQTVVGTNVPGGAVVTADLTGQGLTGTYSVSSNATVASESMTTQATALTVSYDSISGSFIVQSGITGTASTAAFATGPLAAPLLLTQATGAMISQGAAAAVPGPFMTSVTQITQDWATFSTLFNPDGTSGGNAVKLAFAAWTNAQQDRYAYVCWDNDITPTLSFQATQSLGYLLTQNNYSGTILWWEPGNLYHAAFGAGWAASIDFNNYLGRASLAYKTQTGLTPSVSNEFIADNLEANGYNYYGAVATANQGFEFSFPGSVTGPFEWADSYINQIWLNNAIQLAELELLTQVKSIPYNKAGYALIEAAALDPINQALYNGVISTGIPLSSAQAAELNSAAGIPIDQIVTQQGYYFQVRPALPQVRQARQSPPINLWYTDGESINLLVINSIDVQ